MLSRDLVRGTCRTDPAERWGDAPRSTLCVVVTRRERIEQEQAAKRQEADDRKAVTVEARRNLEILRALPGVLKTSGLPPDQEVRKPLPFQGGKAAARKKYRSLGDGWTIGTISYAIGGREGGTTANSDVVVLPNGRVSGFLHAGRPPVNQPKTVADFYAQKGLGALAGMVKRFVESHPEVDWPASIPLD